MFEARGVGTTTKQIQESPQGALYCWVHSNTDYARRLAAHLGRKDLRFCGPEYLRNNRYRGLPVQVVVDHAVELPFSMRAEVQAHNATRE